uniref:Uncharacterized protein n=1 Tax=Aegilops tauschii subsp. strangulata TaxID=200361 RepID=A0A453HYT1_AEGTS
MCGSSNYRQNRVTLFYSFSVREFHVLKNNKRVTVNNCVIYFKLSALQEKRFLPSSIVEQQGQ